MVLVSAAQSLVTSQVSAQQTFPAGISSLLSPPSIEPSSHSPWDMRISEPAGLSSSIAPSHTQRHSPSFGPGDFELLDGTELNDDRQQLSALELLFSELVPLCTNTGGATRWNAPQHLISSSQGPCVDWQLPGLESPHLWLTKETELTSSETLSDPDLSDAEAPSPSFLGSRHSPEPQEGQIMKFDDCLRTTAGRRRNSPRVGHDRTATPHGPLICTASESQHGDGSPLPGFFPPLLSARESGEDIWKPEDFGHVKSLPQVAYHRLLDNFERLNADNGYHVPFANGEFPSLTAFNAFIQLYFEAFHPIFPLLHQPTYDPGKEHWVLLLAVAATGCRFSQVPGAADSGNLLQEFLRRAILFTVRQEPRHEASLITLQHCRGALLIPPCGVGRAGVWIDMPTMAGPSSLAE